jgi:ankyrin repeat protein
LIDVDAATSDGTTAFCWAAWQGHLQVLHVLKDAGCNVHATNSFGCTPVLWAAQGTRPNASTKHTDRFDTVARRNTVESADVRCHEMEKFRTVQVIELLESVGCPIYTINNAGHGVLHKAAQRGNRALCEWYMLERLIPSLKEQFRSRNEENKTMIDQSNINHYLQLIGPDNDGCSPSDLAGMEHHTDLGVFLAQQEEIVVDIICQTFASTSANQVEIIATANFISIFPSWLQSQSLPARNQEEHMLFEPWAGVHRMRSKVTKYRNNWI